MESTKSKKIASRLLSEMIDNLNINNFISKEKLNILNEEDKSQVMRFAQHLLDVFQEKLDFDPELTLEEELTQ